MSNYTKTTNFTSKDSLSSGNPLKIVRGAEHDTEYSNIATAIQTKADSASPSLTGTATAVNITVSGNLLVGTDTATTNTATQTLTNKTLTSPTINGGTITSITDLTVADGGTGASTATDARTNLSAAKSGANSDITSITGLTTALTVAQGGTGATTLTANNVLLGNGTSAPQAVAPSTSGNVLTSNGTTWVSSTPSTANASQLAKAWVNFIGSSGTTRSSYNVTSITRNGTGDYTINFTTAFSSVNYTPVAMGMRDSDGNGSLNTTVRGNATYSNSFTTTTLRVLAENDSGTRVDPLYYGVVCFA